MPAPPLELVFQETRSFVFGGSEHCPDCTRVLDDTILDPDRGLQAPDFDISVTSDGCVVVSDAFIAACEDIEGARWTAIKALTGYSMLHVDRVVRVDPFGNKVRVGPTCQECGGPRYVVRRGPLRLADDATVESGFSRTDVTFGDTADFGPEHPIHLRPAIVVDSETARSLKAAGLRGVHVIALPDETVNPWTR